VIHILFILFTVELKMKKSVKEISLWRVGLSHLYG